MGFACSAAERVGGITLSCAGGDYSLIQLQSPLVTRRFTYI